MLLGMGQSGVTAGRRVIVGAWLVAASCAPAQNLQRPQPEPAPLSRTSAPPPESPATAPALPAPRPTEPKTTEPGFAATLDGVDWSDKATYVAYLMDKPNQTGPDILGKRNLVITLARPDGESLSVRINWTDGMLMGEYPYFCDKKYCTDDYDVRRSDGRRDWRHTQPFVLTLLRADPIGTQALRVSVKMEGTLTSPDSDKSAAPATQQLSLRIENVIVPDLGGAVGIVGTRPRSIPRLPPTP